MQDPTREIKIKCNADMFVDDAPLLHNDKRLDADAITLMAHIQHDAETWGQLLWASGRLLELAKSTYFLVILSFTEVGRPRILTDQELPPNTVCVTDATGCSTVLTRALANDGIKCLE
eukprot:4681819-Ditylum_brightwellii.AAC.1